MSASFQDRYDTAKPTYTRVNEKRFADLPAGTTVLIPSPQDIEAAINRIPTGGTWSLTNLRDNLAERHGADGCCPVMTGMNLRVAAEVNLEAIDAGVPTEEVVPVWKAIDPASNLAGKVPGARKRIEELRRLYP